MTLPPPDTKVLAFDKGDGKITPIIAVYIPRYHRELEYHFEDLDYEYLEEKDTCYWLPGWYECVSNWVDFSYLRVIPQNNIIDWQPINYPAEL